MPYPLPCDCLDCREAQFVLTGVGEHKYRLDVRDDAWRWLCDCGSRGRWQGQSPNAAFHSWKRHARLEV